MSTAHPDVLNETAQGQLKSYIERAEYQIVQIEEQRDYLKEIFVEAKSSGFDVKIIKRVIKYRTKDRAKLQEEESIFDLYLAALGELPLFEAREATSAPQPSPAAADGPSADDPNVSISVAGGPPVPVTLSTLKAAVDTVKGKLRAKPQSEPAGQTDLYTRAVEIVRATNTASTSLIQRKLQIGYNTAANLVEVMQSRGVISAPDARGHREVLVESPTVYGGRSPKARKPKASR